MKDPLDGICAPLRFTPADYSVSRYSGRISIGTGREQPDSERTWRLPAGAERRGVTIETNDANVVWDIYFGRASSTTTTVDLPDVDAPELPTSGVDALLPLDADIRARTTDGPNGWVSELTTGLTPKRWWRLSDDAWLALDEQGHLASVVAKSATAIPTQLEVLVDPARPFDARMYVNGKRRLLEIERTTVAEPDDDHEEMLELIERENASVSEWIASDAPLPNPPEMPDYEYDCPVSVTLSTPDGNCSVFTSSGELSRIEAEPTQGVVELPEDAPILSEAVRWSVDISGGVSTTFESSGDTLRARTNLAEIEPDAWHRVGAALCGTAGDRLVALGLERVDVRRPEDHYDEDFGHHGMGDHLAMMRSWDWDALETTPAFSTVGLAYWDGPVSGGPHPGNVSDDDDQLNQEITLHYGSNNDPTELVVEVESRPHADPYGLMHDDDYDQDASWMAHALRAEALRDATSEKAAEKAFREVEAFATELATLPWESGELTIDEEQVPVRIRRSDTVWVARGQVDSSFITIRVRGFQPDELTFGRVSSLEPFIEAGRAQHEKHLEMMDAMPEHVHRGPDAVDIELMKLTSRISDLLNDPGLVERIAPDVLARHGGAELYRRKLAIYQGVRFANCGGGHGGKPIRSSDDSRAITTMHKDLPDSSRRGTMIVMTSVSSSDGEEEAPPFPELSDDDVTLDDGRVDFQLRWVRVDGEWLLENDFVAHFERLFGPIETVILPAR